MEREEPHYQMFTDIFSRLIIRDAVRTGEDKNNETEVMKYAVTNEKATKSVHFAEKNVKEVCFFFCSEKGPHSRKSCMSRTERQKSCVILNCE